MSKEELLEVARKSAEELRKSKQDNQRLLQQRETMQVVNNANNSTLTRLFNSLKEGVVAFSERIDNPVCHWKGCKKSFDDIQLLHDHMKLHVKNTGGRIVHGHAY